MIFVQNFWQILLNNHQYDYNEDLLPKLIPQEHICTSLDLKDRDYLKNSLEKEANFQNSIIKHNEHL